MAILIKLKNLGKIEVRHQVSEGSESDLSDIPTFKK